MTDGTTTALESQLAAALGANDSRLFSSLLRMLARGIRVDPIAACVGAGIDADDAEAALASLPLERDGEGFIVGAGLTLTPTPHVFEINGTRLYTWCALDALTFPEILGVTARVTSPSALTGVPITMIVGPDGVTGLAPRGACVVLVAPIDGEPLRSSFCADVSFFASAAGADAWCAQSRRSDAHVVTIDAAHAIGRRLAKLMSAADRRACCDGA